MAKDTTAHADGVHLRVNIRGLLRRRVLEAIEAMLEEELAEAISGGRYGRSPDPQADRNGHERRRTTAAAGSEDLEILRRRIAGDDDTTTELWSELLPRSLRQVGPRIASSLFVADFSSCLTCHSLPGARSCHE